MEALGMIPPKLTVPSLEARGVDCRAYLGAASLSGSKSGSDPVTGASQVSR